MVLVGKHLNTWCVMGEHKGGRGQPFKEHSYTYNVPHVSEHTPYPHPTPPPPPHTHVRVDTHTRAHIHTATTVPSARGLTQSCPCRLFLANLNRRLFTRCAALHMAWVQPVTFHLHRQPSHWLR